MTDTAAHPPDTGTSTGTGTTLSHGDAVALTAELVAVIEITVNLALRAYRGRIWVPLGYPDWETFCTAELPEGRRLLDTDAGMRRLLAEGMSQRAVAAVAGVSRDDVRKAAGRPARHDIPTGGAVSSTNGPTGKVLGQDGVIQRRRPAADEDTLREAEECSRNTGIAYRPLWDAFKERGLTQTQAREINFRVHPDRKPVIDAAGVRRGGKEKGKYTPKPTATTTTAPTVTATTAVTDTTDDETAATRPDLASVPPTPPSERYRESDVLAAAQILIARLSGRKYAEWAADLRAARHQGQHQWADEAVQTIDQASKLLSNIARIGHDDEVLARATNGFLTYDEVFNSPTTPALKVAR